MEGLADRTVKLDLPAVPERRLAVRLTPDALRQVRGGHPWVFDRAIVSNSIPDAPAGSLAVIFDSKRDFAGIGLWDPESPIRIRMLHAGKPVRVDDAFWSAAVERALAARSALGDNTTGWRLIHGENDGMPGLVVDRYDDTLVCKVYSPCWLPHLESIFAALHAHVAPSRIVLRLGRLASKASETGKAGLIDGMVVSGPEVDREIEFVENGLRFTADVLDGQKTGYFLDQRDNRQRVRDHVASRPEKNTSVLDVFSCGGGFSVYAAAGGASLVHSVDISAPAIANAKQHMALNTAVVGNPTHMATTGDAFEVMADLASVGTTFNVVVVDPPSFASKESERHGAIRAYRKLADLATVLVAPGGRLVQASCSARVTQDELYSTVSSAVRSHRRTIHNEEFHGHALDHPIGFAEGGYLKAITLDLS